MAYDITAANAVFTITVAGLYNAPITLQNFAADQAWETAELNCAETEMSVDGYLNTGWTPAPVDQTIHFSAGSESVVVFEAIMAAQQTARALFRLGGELTLTGTGRRYTMTNGVLRSMAVVPSAGRVLHPRSFAIRWQSVWPAGV
ncbi:hypothetical protein OQ496_12685 [Acetobacter suratthaniensis]|uniref:Phage tail protein n=1 Tax=Acetobacter suratthaniensis TaxID=1502841 RepID=A0ABS3LPH8_9PROT|nr:hypothetical protein [Acetobacter suratthaniensis]MBO1329246.1 hypothetical protein [Acetobacter suratthaniensis]MCX2567308.1 hypothetical protein [Acetobacter suratthaniensis]